MKTLILLILLGVWTSIADAAVFFSENFEAYPSDWMCTDYDLWSVGYQNCGTTSGFGDEMRIGAGHNSSNGLYVYKNYLVPNGYRSLLLYWLPSGDAHQDIYHRWYMQIPTAANFNKAIDEGFKFWRYYGRENGFSNPPEIYLNVHGSTFASGNLSIYNDITGYLPLIPVSDFNDEQWHCHELRLRWNDYGQSNGVIQYWLDGVQKASFTGLSFSNIADTKTYNIEVGVGNVSDSAWYQTEWSAIVFDDIAVGTSYIGTIYSFQSKGSVLL